MRAIACDDCLVTVLLGPVGSGHGRSPAPEYFDDQEGAAMGVLVEHGLVPPLRDPRGRVGA
jgi:hypothetical protein